MTNRDRLRELRAAMAERPLSVDELREAARLLSAEGLEAESQAAWAKAERHAARDRIAVLTADGREPTPAELYELAGLYRKLGREADAVAAGARALESYTPPAAEAQSPPNVLQPALGSTDEQWRVVRRTALVFGLPLTALALAVAAWATWGISPRSKAPDTTSPSTNNGLWAPGFETVVPDQPEPPPREPSSLSDSPLGWALADKAGALETLCLSAGGWAEMGSTPDKPQQAWIELNAAGDCTEDVAAWMLDQTADLLAGLPDGSRVLVSVEDPNHLILAQQVFTYLDGTLVRL